MYGELHYQIEGSSNIVTIEFSEITANTESEGVLPKELKTITLFYNPKSYYC